MTAKLNDFSRREAVVFPVKVSISKKRCNIETLLLETPNRRWCMPMESCHFQQHGVAFNSPTASLFRHELSYSRAAAAVGKISTASRGPSSFAILLVWIITDYIVSKYISKSLIHTRTLQPVATCSQSSFVHKPTIVKLLLLIYGFQFRSAFLY